MSEEGRLFSQARLTFANLFCEYRAKFLLSDTGTSLTTAQLQSLKRSRRSYGNQQSSQSSQSSEHFWDHWDDRDDPDDHMETRLKVTYPSEDEQKYTINKRTSKKDAKCATCKKELSEGNIQATTEGPYRTIQKSWIKRTFFFCPRFQCMGKLPRNSFIRPYKTGMTLLIETPLTGQQKKEIDSQI